MYGYSPYIRAGYAQKKASLLLLLLLLYMIFGAQNDSTEPNYQ